MVKNTQIRYVQFMGFNSQPIISKAEPLLDKLQDENKQYNERFASGHHERGLVCVFAGATSGIGASALERMATMLHAPTFYVIGRSSIRFASQRAKLESLNPSCKVVFLEAEVSLISDVDTACEHIIAAEKKVDHLYMSPGLMPLNGAQYTKEGLDTCFVLSYYSRMRLTSNLLPLLRQSPRPRVLSVLNGGEEKPLLEKDLGLKEHLSTARVMKHTITMMSLAFEYLAQNENDRKITFMHAAPGLVKTNIFSRLTAPESSGLVWRIILPLIQGLAGILYWMFAISSEESGERQAFHLTSDDFGPGAWRINSSSEKVPMSPKCVVEQYVERGWPEKVWEHTMRVFDESLAVK